MHQARHGAGSPARHSADTPASQSRHSAASPKRHSPATPMSRIRPRVLVALVVAGAGLTTAIWLPTRHDAADASERARNRQLAERRVSQLENFTFADNFSGGQGSRVDGDKWSVETNSSRAVALDGNGHLVLTAYQRRSGEFTSGRLLTRETFQQSAGRVEARIKVADGNGISSAFRLFGAGALDVARNLGQNSRAVSAALQDPGSDFSGDDEISGSFKSETSFAEDFHNYAVEWRPDLIVWSIDGAEFFRATTADSKFFDQPFSLNLDLAVDPKLSQHTRSPQRMLVDFVHVTALDEKAPPSEDPTAAPTTAPPTEPPATKPPATTAPPTTTAPTTAPPATTAPPTTAPPAATPWKPFTDYVAGQLVTYEGVEYQVQETHTSLPGWEPPALPSLFKKL
jgi:beta-glucanase (GH16 family)